MAFLIPSAALLNLEEPEWCDKLLEKAASSLEEALGSAEPADHDRARLLIRLLCCLAALRVLQPAACMQLLQRLVEAAAGSGGLGAGA